MLAVIIGNSQSGGAGRVLEDVLKSSGRSVKRFYKNGSGNEDLKRQLSMAGSGYDVVYIFGGDDDLNGIQDVMDMIGGGVPVYWWGSSPATRISSISTARSVFGSKVSGEFYWFDSGEADRREKRNKNLKSILSKYPNIRYMDYRDFNVNGAVVQRSGVSWPDQPDGIHISTSTAKSLFSSNYAAGISERSYVGPGMFATVIIALVIGGVVAYARRSGKS